MNIPCAVFETDQGWAGVIATGSGLVRSILPVKTREKVERLLVVSGNIADRLTQPDKEAVELISAYYRGEPVDLSKIALDLTDVPPFDRKVYEVLRGIGRGRVISYGQAAGIIGMQRAARAVGGAVGRNPLPPFIPCHRVVGVGGSLVGFSSEGGIGLKRRLLEMEGVAFKGDRVVF